jgi:hypothetical protein
MHYMKIERGSLIKKAIDEVVSAYLNGQKLLQR